MAVKAVLSTRLMQDSVTIFIAQTAHWKSGTIELLKLNVAFIRNTILAIVIKSENIHSPIRAVFMII